MSNSKLVTFRAFPEQLASAIEARRDHGEPLGAVARTQLERYFALLDQELERVQLSEAEAMLICDSLNGIISDPQTMRIGLWAGVDDSIHLDGLDEKWSVDGPALIAKLRALTPAQAFAVTDAVECWWGRNEIDEDPRERLRIVGLIR